MSKLGCHCDNGWVSIACSIFSFIDVNITLEPEWWQVFIFPIWYGANMEMLLNGDYQPYYLFFSCFSNRDSSVSHLDLYEI